MTGQRATAVVFPFDLFGSGGSAAGAELLADELREIVADFRRETVPTRAAAYADRLRFREAAFPTLDDLAGWRERGRALARRALRDGDFLLWLTGNHLGALPLYDELAALPRPPLVVQLDAHLDIHHFRDCAPDPTHGNFLLHVAGTLPPLVNVGHRELLLPVEYVAGFYRQTFGAADLASGTEALADLRRMADEAGAVFLDVDCDVFDPSAFPAVARPVPFGLSPAQVLAAVSAVDGPRLCGVAVSEFDPGRDDRDRSLAAAAWLVEHLLLRKFE